MHDEPTVLFAARLMPPRIVGGLERFSADVLAGLKGEFPVVDLAHYGGRKAQPVYMATLSARLRRRARVAKQAGHAVVIDGSDASLAAPLARQAVPTMARIHGLDILHPSRAYQRYVRRYLGGIDYLVANSSNTRDLLDAFDYPAERTRVINPAADAPEGWTPATVRGRMLYVGRLVARKGALELVRDVWPTVIDAYPEASLDLVGDGPEAAALQRAIAQAPSSDRITWHGQLSQEELEQRFRQADVFCMANRHVDGDWEGFGIVAAESASRGVPVVAKAIDGIPDAVAVGRTGLLVDESDPAAFAHAVLSVLDRRKLGDRKSVAEEAAARWSTARLRRQYRDLILEIAEHG